MHTMTLSSLRPLAVALALATVLPAVPASAQSDAEVRLRKIEAEVRALQRTVFPGGDGKYFPPQIAPGSTPAVTPGTPASTPVTDLLARVEAIEAQLARLTAASEENANRIAKLERAVAATTAVTAASSAATTAAATPAAPAASTPSANLAAMTGGASGAVAPKPASAAPATTAPKPPSAERVAAVKAVAKPATGDAADDEYSYGFRLWEAKLYPEAQQQLKLYLNKYPKHPRVSFARNLLGRAYLDEGKPRDAASWFLQNYQADKKGDRAPDSLLYLADAMKRLGDTNRACIALGQFADDYAAEAAGRLRSQYEALRGGTKCT
jgi:TolA-binding protein